jgi:RNA polymerase sigma-70 factor (ECF subfamily)
MLPAMAPDPDAILMTRYRDGDIRSFEVLYGRHKGPLYRYFLRQCREAELASELFQDVWTRIIGARERYEPTARFQTYMYQIAHNCLADHYRRKGRAPLSCDLNDEAHDVPADRSDGPEQHAERDEAAGRLRAALGALPPAQRDAFLLHQEAELSIAEIASVTGANPETVKSRLRYAMNRLRENLRGEGT